MKDSPDTNQISWKASLPLANVLYLILTVEILSNRETTLRNDSPKRRDYTLVLGSIVITLIDSLLTGLINQRYIRFGALD